MLPRPGAMDEEDGPSELTRQLLEYRLAKDASVFLANRSSQDLRSYASPKAEPKWPKERSVEPSARPRIRIGG